MPHAARPVNDLALLWHCRGILLSRIGVAEGVGCEGRRPGRESHRPACKSEMTRGLFGADGRGMHRPPG